jgi:hypothetical protein
MALLATLPALAGAAGQFTIPAAAFLGAMALVGIVYWLAYSSRDTDSTTTLILAGVAAGSFASALTSFLMLRSQGELRRAVAWLMGGRRCQRLDACRGNPPLYLQQCGCAGVQRHTLNVYSSARQALQLACLCAKPGGCLCWQLRWRLLPPCLFPASSGSSG